MMNKINLLFVTLFGIGYLKFAPGTWASLVTSILLFIIFHVLNISSTFVLLILLPNLLPNLLDLWGSSSELISARSALDFVLLIILY